MQLGSFGAVTNNRFYSDNPDPVFVLRQRLLGFTNGWRLQNNSIHSIDTLQSVLAPTPAIGTLQYTEDGSLLISLLNRVPQDSTLIAHVTIDDLWPTANLLVWEVRG